MIWAGLTKLVRPDQARPIWLDLARSQFGQVWKDLTRSYGLVWALRAQCNGVDSVVSS